MSCSASLRMAVLSALEEDQRLEDVVRLEAIAKKALALAASPDERVNCCICAARVATRMVKTVSAREMALIYLEDGLFLLAEGVMSLESLQPRQVLEQVLVCGMDLWSEARKLISLCDSDAMFEGKEFKERMVSVFGGLPEASLRPDAKTLCAGDEHLVRMKKLMLALGDPDFSVDELVALGEHLPLYFYRGASSEGASSPTT